MTGWRNSSEHNANLLMKNATRIGVAIAKDPHTRYGVYWALELASEPQRKTLRRRGAVRRRVARLARSEPHSYGSSQRAS